MNLIANTLNQETVENKREKLTLEDKKTMLSELIKEKQRQFEDFETAQMQTLESSNKQAGENEDRFENPREQMIDELEMRSGVLDKLKTDIELLRTMHAGEPLDTVEHGALVQTEDLRIFVAVAHPERISGNEKLVSISTDAPIFRAMKGKKAGESFEFNGKTRKITDVI